MLGGHGGPQVPVSHCGVHGLSPHQGCSHSSLRETPRWQQRCNRQEFRQKATNPQTQTNAKEEIPAYFLPFFFFSSCYSPDPPHPNPPFTSSSAIPGAQGLKEGQNQVPGSCCVLPSAPGTQEGLVAERPLPGRSLRCAPASPSSGASPAAPQTRLEIVWWPQPG